MLKIIIFNYKFLDIMNTRVLRTFLKISQFNSFSKAAQQLHMTDSAVSMQMKSLENELNVQLFDRRFRPPQLTPIARQLISHAEAIVFEEKKLRAVCMSDNALIGDFELGLIMTASVRLLPRIFECAAKHSPSTNFKISTGLSKDLTGRVITGQLDAAIVTTTVNDNVLQSDPLLTENLVFGIPGKCWADAQSVERLNIPFLHFSPTSGVGEVISGCLKELAVDPPQRIVLDSIEAIVECVNSGIGFTLLPEPEVIRYADDSLVIFEPSIRATREIALITRKDRMSSKLRSALLNLFSHGWTTTEVGPRT